MPRSKTDTVPRARRIPRRTYDIVLTGELEGFTVTMSSMSGRDIIAIRGEKMDEGQMLGFVADHCLAHNIPDLEDLRDLDYVWLLQILREWSDALREVALPQASGGS